MRNLQLHTMRTSASENGYEGGNIMNSYQINEQLSALNMKTMKLEYQRQCELPAMSDLSFDERFAMIVNAQYTARQEARIKRMIKNAKLRDETASLAGIDNDPVRKLQKSKVAELSDCEWIRNGSNLIIIGSTGVGKTYLSSAFGREACIKGFSVKAFRVTRLLTDLGIGRGDGSYNKIMDDMVKPDLLILDDFGIKQFDVGVSQDMLDLFDERWRQQKSIAISAQLPVKNWPSVFKDPTIADAIMDRVVRNAHRFDLKGPSRRPTLVHTPSDDDNQETE